MNFVNIVDNVKNETNFKGNINLLYYQTRLVYFEFFNIIKTKINKIKILKYKNIKEYKELIIFYNNFIKKYKILLFNIEYETFTIDLIKKNNIDNVVLLPEISPFKISHDIYNNIIKSKTKSLKIKGLICFIVFKKTKTKEEIKICIFNDIYHKKDNLYIYNINEIINFINPQLLEELRILIQKDLYKDYVNASKDCSINDLFLGYLATLSVNDKNYNKLDILDMLYFYNEYLNSNVLLHVYFKIEQYKKNSNNYKIYDELDKNIFNDFKYIVYDLEFNDNHMDPGLWLNNNSIYITSSNFIHAEIYEEDKILNYIYIDKDNKITLPMIYNNNVFNYMCDLKSLLYSNLYNKDKKINYDNLIILKHTEQIYIRDIFINVESRNKNIIYKYADETYILKKNNIILKKDKKNILNIIFKIDSDCIDWYDFIKNSDITKINNLYMWFINNFNIYKNNNSIKAKQIINSFQYMSLHDIFKAIFDISPEKFKEFIIYYNDNYKFENKEIIKKNKTAKNVNFDNFIDIIKIFLFMHNF